MKNIIVYTDGGSRGNPGLAAIGVVIKDEKGGLIKSYGGKIGETTNNVAEYSAVISALQKIKLLLGRGEIKHVSVEVNTDSELVANHLNNRYKVEDSELVPLFMEVWNLKTEFGNVTFKHVVREENREADRLVNEALDSEKKTRQKH